MWCILFILHWTKNTLKMFLLFLTMLSFIDWMNLENTPCWGFHCCSFQSDKKQNYCKSDISHIIKEEKYNNTSVSITECLFSKYVSWAQMLEQTKSLPQANSLKVFKLCVWRDDRLYPGLDFLNITVDDCYKNSSNLTRILILTVVSSIWNIECWLVYFGAGFPNYMTK